jgi:hypothetical protein
MSWHFSRVLVEASLAESFLDGEPFAPLKSNPTLSGFLSPDRMKAFFRLSRFGMTFAPLTDDRGEELLTWFLAGFPAKTSVQPEKEQELQAQEVDYGKNSHESLMKYDLNTHSWKTRPSLENGDWTPCSPTLPKSGMMQNGVCSVVKMWEHHISGKGCGFWPTITVSDISPRVNARCEGLFIDKTGKLRRRTYRGRSASMGLARLLLEEYGSNLTSKFAEWWMAWPIGWTGLSLLGTDKFQSWLQQHGIFCTTESNNITESENGF